MVFREPIAIPADSDSSSESEDNAVADPIEFASPPTPPPAEVTPTPAPLPEIAGESAGPVSGSPSDSPPLREQLAELLRLDMDPFALQYQEDPNHSCHFAFLSDSSLIERKPCDLDSQSGVVTRAVVLV